VTIADARASWRSFVDYVRKGKGDSELTVTRLAARLASDSRRVLARPFIPEGASRIRAVLERVAVLPDADVATVLAAVVADYGRRHKDILDAFRQNFATAVSYLEGPAELSGDRRLLAGAYFTSEYSLEGAALFNPSMVLHPDQVGVPKGSSRFIMSLRACGEGHISSIEFRTGIVDTRCNVLVDSPTQFVVTARPRADTRYHKAIYGRKLAEMAPHQELAESVLEQLASEFAMSDLKAAIATCRPTDETHASFKETTESMLWLARSNYELDFPADSKLSERVVYPVSENESRGIEDARFVRFTEPDGQVAYYATYTAYNGFRVLPQLILTNDFRHFKVSTLNGRCVQNKGMALFPRKVGNDFVMAARLDGENIYLLRSDNIHFWNSSKLVYTPKASWEVVQVGNCGSPFETDKGWVLLTHGVGPMRQYWIGAILLDLEDPSRVLGRLTEPLLMPDPAERDGYVPNVLYSCGAMRHQDHLIVPYAVADTRIRIAAVSLPDLLARLTASGP
jgi:predicted GH43/DUF377 family glycosyl hydrolase